MQKQDPAQPLPPGPQSALLRFLYNAFVLPFKDRSRAYIYFVSFFFALGSAFLDIFIAIDVAALGAAELTRFLVGKFGLIMVLIPIGVYGIGRVKDPVLYGAYLLLVVCALGFIMAQGGQVSPLEAGLLFAVAVSPFWAVFHVMFATATTDDNIGNEVSLAGTGMTVGMTFGFVLGGLCSQYDLEAIGMIAGFGVLIVSTAALVLRAMTTGFSRNLRESGAMDETLFGAFKRCRYRSIGVFLEGIFQLPSGNLWIVYLSLSGIAAGAVGIWQGVMVLARVVVTPFAGALVNHGRRREMLLGSGLNLLGWTPFLYGVTTGAVLVFMNVWAVGMQLFSTGLTSAWYSSRTVSGIMVREIVMGMGRTGFIFVLVPLLYADGAAFINTVVVLAAIMVIYSVLWMRSIRMKGPVLPIENIVTRQ